VLDEGGKSPEQRREISASTLAYPVTLCRRQLLLLVLALVLVLVVSPFPACVWHVISGTSSISSSPRRALVESCLISSRAAAPSCAASQVGALVLSAVQKALLLSTVFSQASRNAATTRRIPLGAVFAGAMGRGTARNSASIRCCADDPNQMFRLAVVVVVVDVVIVVLFVVALLVPAAAGNDDDDDDDEGGLFGLGGAVAWK
jgi:hypothetical protein